jgi:hypothetical protein
VLAAVASALVETLALAVAASLRARREFWIGLRLAIRAIHRAIATLPYAFVVTDRAHVHLFERAERVDVVIAARDRGRKKKNADDEREDDDRRRDDVLTSYGCGGHWGVACSPLPMRSSRHASVDPQAISSDRKHA